MVPSEDSEGCLASFFSDPRSLFHARLLADVHMFCPVGLELSFCVIKSTFVQTYTTVRVQYTYVYCYEYV